MEEQDMYEAVYDLVEELKEDGYSHNQIRSKITILINKVWADIERDNREDIE